jgi:hypothetical protein
VVLESGKVSKLERFRVAELKSSKVAKLQRFKEREVVVILL